MSGLIVDRRGSLVGGGGGSGTVTSVNDILPDVTGDITLTKSDLLLGNVQNVDQTNPSNIIQDSTHRFVSDTEKATWNTSGSSSDIIDTHYVTNDKSATFNGTSSYIDYGNTFNKDRTDAFSISFWVKTASTATSQEMFSKKATSSTPGYNFRLESGNRYIFTLGNNSTNSISIRTPAGTGVTVNVWAHIVITYDGSSVAAGFKIYRDGVPYTLSTVTDALSATTVSSTPLRLGYFNGTFPFGGQIDDFTTWNTALDAYDVYELFAGQTRKDPNYHTKAANLVNWWKLGDGDTTTSLDQIGGATGTLTSVTYATDTPFSSDTDIENNPAATYDAFLVHGRPIAITPYGTPTLQTAPSSTTGSTGNYSEWSPSGRYLVLAGNGTGTSGFAIYERIGDTLTKLPSPVVPPAGNVNVASWSPDERFVAFGTNTTTAQNFWVYERDGHVFTKLPLATYQLPAAPLRIAWSPDGRLLSCAHLNSPYITTLERGGTYGNTFTKIADPATLPTTDLFSVAYSPDGTLLAVGLSGNAVELYSVSGSTLTKISGSYTTLGAVSHLSWSPNGKFLSAIFPTAGGYVYRRIGNALYRMPAFDVAPGGVANGSAWSPDSKYLYVAHSDVTNDYCCVYELQNERKFAKQTWTTGLAGSGRGVSVSNCGRFIAIAHATSPFFTWFKSSGTTPKIVGRKPKLVGPQAAMPNSPATVADPTSSFLHPSQGSVHIERWNTNTTAGNLGWTETLNSGTSNMSAGGFGTAVLSTSTSATSSPMLALSTVGHWTVSVGAFSFETKVQLPTISTSTEEFISRFGFFNSLVAGVVGTNGIYFEYDRTQSTFWRVITKSSVTGLNTTTITTNTANTALKTFKIHITSTLVTFLIDGAIVAQISTNIPTTNLIPIYNLTKSVGTTARTMANVWAVIATGQAATAN